MTWLRACLTVLIAAQIASPADAQPSGFQVRLVLDEAAIERGDAEWLDAGDYEDPLPVARQNGLGGGKPACAAVREDEMLQSWALYLEFDAAGTTALSALTREQLDRRIALVLNGKLLVAPYIRSPITDGKVMLTRHGASREAVELEAKAVGDAVPGIVTCPDED